MINELLYVVCNKGADHPPLLTSNQPHHATSHFSHFQGETLCAIREVQSVMAMLWDFWTFLHHFMTTCGPPLGRAPEESHGKLCETLVSEYFVPSHVQLMRFGTFIVAVMVLVFS